MTRLFLRFYVGVLLILLVAWMIQGYVFRTRSEADSTQVIENALSGGVRMANYYVAQNWPDKEKKVLEDLNSVFEYDVRIVPVGSRPLSSEVQQRLDQGEAVLIYGEWMASRIPDSDYQLELGPLPQFSGPTQTDILIVLGVISLLVAIAIAVLLRPVAMQLRAVEKAATGISSGQLGARVDLGGWSASVPLATAFNQMAERTQGLLQSQRELLQAVSHELRTPLAKIRFATDLIAGSKSASERAERLASVDKATEELDQLVGELLTYVKMDSGANRPPYEPVNVSDLVADVVSDQQILSPDIRMDVLGISGQESSGGMESSAEKELLFTTDAAALKRAIKNLVGNAAKFARSRVDVSIELADGELAIEVNDDGPGIPQEHRTRIFEPFVRVSEQSARGVGLGLALVARIVHRLSGRIEVDESPLGGACFRIRVRETQPLDD